MHCNGKCYLAKKLKQAGEGEKKRADKDDIKPMEICLLQHSSYGYSTYESIGIKLPKPLPFYIYKPVTYYIGSVFRPPRIIA